MDKRVLLVGEHLKGEKPMSELCHEFGAAGRARTNGWGATPLCQ
jgi:hypothetical protein